METLLARVERRESSSIPRASRIGCVRLDCPPSPGKTDAQAEQEYLAYLQETYNQISFLFIKPQDNCKRSKPTR